MCIVIAHQITPLFIEILKTDLKLEITDNVVHNLYDVMNHIDAQVGFRRWKSYVSDSCNGLRNERKKLVELKMVGWAYAWAAH